MEWYFVIAIFIASCFILSFLSSRLIKSLIHIGHYLGWREFVVSFFVMAFATSLPNLFVDVNAALHGIPELAFGDILGGNLVDLTIVLAVAVFFSKKELSADSSMVQKTAVFTAIIALLPLVLIWDSSLDRMDGIILIFTFLFYTWWLFSQRGHFKKAYNGIESHHLQFKTFVINIIVAVSLIALLLAASHAVVWSARFFSLKLNISLGLVGLLIVALGNSFPETYFSAVSARKDENWLVLGDLMGSVIVCTTLVLGIVALLFPFQIQDISLFLSARTFLIIAAAFSLLFIITNRRVSKREGLFMLFIYITFLITEIFVV